MIKAKLLPRYPASVEATAPIVSDFSNGTLELSYDSSSLPQTGSISATAKILVRDGAVYQELLATAVSSPSIADQRVLGNVSGGTAAASALTGTQVNTILPAFTGDSGIGGVKGAVPAPAAGDAAANRYLKASGSFATIDFLQSGAGAVTRLAQDKMRDIFNVKDFGAVGNGSTDDTAAIQAAVTAAGSAMILVPIGVYRITAPITSTEAMYIQGMGNAAGPGAAEQDGKPGSIFLLDYANPSLFVITNSLRPSIFRDFAINVNPAYRPAGNGAGISITPGGTTATNANTKIQNVSFNNLYQGIYSVKANWWTIEGCYFGSWTYDAIYTESDGTAEASTGFIRNNFFFGDSASTQRSCIYMKNGYAIIDGNEILGAQAGVVVDASTYPSGFIKIVNNTIEEQYYYGVQIKSGGVIDVSMVDISGNEFSSTVSTASYLSSIFIDDVAARVWLADLQICRNVFRHNGAVALGYIRVAAGKNVLISENIAETIGGTPALFIGVNGVVNNSCWGSPIQVLDNQVTGTFTARYSFSGTAAPILRDQVAMTFAQLPSNTGNGSMVYVSDGRSTAAGDLTVRNGGTGCFAMRQNGVWLTAGYIP
jgi:hypothetical protein